jgi:hypothetical protein
VLTDRVEQRSRWKSLTAELAKPTSPPRRLLAEFFPRARTVQADYRTRVGELRVRRGSANPGTLGSAFDIWVTLQVTARPVLPWASWGARRCGPATSRAYGQLLDRLSPSPTALTVPVGSRSRSAVTGAWTGPSPNLTEPDLLRLCWVSALLTEVYRMGATAAGSPLAGLPRDSPVDLLGLASPEAVEELGELTDLARVGLLRPLHALAADGPTWLSPVFAGSDVMHADADLVTGHTLLEFKTGLGVKSSDSTGPGGAAASARRASLDNLTLYQLLGYVLHDYDDFYALTHVGLYQGRYGKLVVWPLPGLLTAVTGDDVDLPDLRRQWALMLDTGTVPGR